MVFEYTEIFNFLDNKISIFFYLFFCTLLSLTLIYRTLIAEQKIYTIPVLSIFNFTTFSVLITGIFILFFFGLFNASELDDCFLHDLGPLNNNLCSTNISIKLNHHLNYEEVRGFIYENYSSFESLVEMNLSKGINFDDLSTEIKNKHYFGMFISSFVGINNLLINLIIIHFLSFVLITLFEKYKNLFQNTSDISFFRPNLIYTVVFIFFLNAIFSHHNPYPYSYIIDYILFATIFAFNFNSNKVDKNLIISTLIISAINIYYVKTYYLLISFILFSYYILKNFKSLIKYLLIILPLVLITFSINSSKSRIGGHIHSDTNEKYKDIKFNIVKLLQNTHQVRYDTLEHGDIHYEYKIHENKDVSVFKSSMGEVCSERKSYLIPKSSKYFLDLTKKCLKAHEFLSNNNNEYIGIFAISKDSYLYFKDYLGLRHNLIEFSNRLISIPIRLIYGNFRTKIFVDKNNYNHSEYYKNNYFKNFLVSAIPGFFKLEVNRDSFIFSEFVNDYGIKVGVPDNGNMPHSESIMPNTDLYMLLGSVGSIVHVLSLLFIVISILIFSRDRYMKNFNLSFILTVFIMNFETNSLVFFSSAIKFTIALFIINLSFFIFKFIFLRKI